MPILGALLAASALLGQPVPDWPATGVDPWVQGGPLDLRGLRGKVVLIRFFTGTDCPYCSASAPALNALHRELGPEGLVVIGIYTPKPRPRPVPRSEVEGHIRTYGFEFPVALDGDWGALRRLWLDRVPHARFTSSSLLIDRRGRLRHVHEGGAYSREDHRTMREAIVSLLAEP